MSRPREFRDWLARSPWPSYAAGIVVANMLGSAIVFAIIGFAFPASARLGYDEHRVRTIGVFLAYLVVAAVVGTVLFFRCVVPVVLWRRRGGAPTAAEHTAALRLPDRQLLITGSLWTVGGAIFVALAAPSSVRLAAAVAFTVAMGAGATCCLTYLLAERVLRPITGAALATSLPGRHGAPGISTRILLTWGAGSGVPLLGAVLVGVAQLTGVLSPDPEALAVPVIVLGMFGLVIGLYGVVLAVRAITDPVREVGQAMAEVQQGRVNVSVDVYDGSEIGQLQAGFNDMVRGVADRERIRDLFGRHVGQDVAQRALDHGTRLGGESREVAVLFVDLVGSTAMAATRPPDEVVATLNEFFRVIVDIVDQHHGFVNKFEGDAALVVFGAPLDHVDAAGSALTAARHLELALHDLIDDDFGIGVSWGTAVAGNIGAAERFEYTVIGDPVNEAARLTELAKTRRSRCVASAQTVAQADEEEAGHWTVRGRTRLRGRATVTRLAEPR